MAAAENIAAGSAGQAPGSGESIRSMVGEPETVQNIGDSMIDYGERMVQLATNLRRIRDSDLSQWVFRGEAADSLRESIGDSADKVALAGALYRPVGVALKDYGTQTAASQESLDSGAVSCRDAWEDYQKLDGELGAAALPDADDEKAAEERFDLDADVHDAHATWMTAASLWDNDFLAWRDGVYEPALAALGDPDLDDVRDGELPDTSNPDIYPHGDPVLEDVDQGGYNDCYLLSVLAGMAEGDPQRVKDMITANPDGTFTVHFADGDITVGPEDLLDGDQAEWVRIIEAAYLEHEGSMEEFDNGGSMSEVMEDIFGRGTDNLDNEPGFWDWLVGGNDIADGQDDIMEAIDDGLPVVVSAHNGQLGFGEDGSLGHALTVTDITEDENGEVIVTVRNPWGHNSGHQDQIEAAGGELGPNGTFTMSWDDFASSFTQVVIANE